MTEVLTSCYDISQAFIPDLPMPAGGFAASPAFNATSSLAQRLKTEHDAAIDGLYYGNEDPPSFEDVLDRVHTNRELLDATAAE